MSGFRFLSLDEIVELRDEQLDLYGGAAGIRDPGALDSAVAMPMLIFADQYAHPDLAAMAAAYLFHLTRGHPVIDGNKRTGAIACDVFLLLNERELTLTSDEFAEITLRVADGGLDKEPLAEIIRSHLTDIRSEP